MTPEFEIIVTEHAGFCFGVKRAVERAFELASKPGLRVYTLGSIIHNSIVTDRLASLGVDTIAPEDIPTVLERARSGERSVVLVRAHGIERSALEALKQAADECEAFGYEDLTCPNVSKIHRCVAENSDENTLTVVIGDEIHPEVRGIVSYANGPVRVFSDSEGVFDVKDWQNKTIMVAQTTQKLTEWKKSQKNIKKVCTNALIFDTICNVTEIRQTETTSLAQKVDLMLVIGGANSSNTAKLFHIARQLQPLTYFARDASSLPLEELRTEIERILSGQLNSATPHLTVGITAGASTPSGNIEEVILTMSELINKSNPAAEEAEDFAGMLESSLKTLNTGEIVTGVITSVSTGELHVDLGAKVTGIIPYDEITTDNSVKLEEMFKPGDEIEAMVTRVSDLDGIATLSKRRIDNIKNWRAIVAAAGTEDILEGKVTDVVKGGLLLSIGGTSVFVPASHSGLPKDADLSTLIGTVQRVRILEVNEGRKRAVASIRSVLRDERKKAEAEFWANIEDGKQYRGKVKSLTSYGAFVDLGGVDGMVHSTELSWRHIKHPSEVVNVGDEIDVYVKKFDPETRRISLGYKTEETNPWNIFRSKYNVGDVAEVKIVSMMPFGAFAEVVPGADGLIHISEIANHKVQKPADELELGQIVKVKVIDIDEENRRISLSMRALLNEDAEEASDAE